MKKKRLIEKLGGGAKGASYGVNSSGPHNARYKTKYPTGYHTGGLQGDADSIFSQRLGTISTVNEEELDYLEDPDMLEEEETLMEFFARLIKMPLTETLEELQDEDMEEDMEEDMDEMSVAGSVGGVTGKFGLYNADGSKTSKSQYKKQKAKQKEWK